MYIIHLQDTYLSIFNPRRMREVILCVCVSMCLCVRASVCYILYLFE